MTSNLRSNLGRVLVNACDITAKLQGFDKQYDLVQIIYFILCSVSPSVKITSTNFKGYIRIKRMIIKSTIFLFRQN